VVPAWRLRLLAGAEAVDFEIGDVVRVSTDEDPPTVKEHTVTAVAATEVDPVRATISGVTDTDAFSVEVGFHDEDGWYYEYVPAEDFEDLGGGLFAWTADFSEIADIELGVAGDAWQSDEGWDATWSHWQVHLLDLDVVPADGAVEVGETLQLEAQATMTLDREPHEEDADAEWPTTTYLVDVAPARCGPPTTPGVATVDDSGVVTGVAEGAAQITRHLRGRAGHGRR
jgi:hypothetical protein